MRTPIVLALLAALTACAARSAPSAAPASGLSTDDRLEDFDQLWSFVQARYPFFDAKATDWDCVRKRYRPLAGDAKDLPALIRVFEDTLDELYDAHTHLRTNLADSWRLPPYDLYAEREGDGAVVRQSRNPGISAGAHVEEIDGAAVPAAIAARAPRCLTRPDPAADAWALQSLLSGRHDRPRVLQVRGRGESVRLTLEASDPPPEPAVSDRTLAHDVALIRIASFADESTIAAFDAALERHRDARALVLDVRANGGGDTAVGVPILGRFFSSKTLYARMARRDGARMSATWDEWIEPRGPWTWKKPVVVVADHFSESLAEGFAMALQETGRAKLVGTQMAGLDAGVVTVTLQHSGIQAQVSAEPVHRVDGALRSATRPDVGVDLAATPGADPILDAALKAL